MTVYDLLFQRFLFTMNTELQYSLEEYNMSFDGIFTHLMVDELSEQLVNGRLSKVQQPYENELMLVIRNQGKNHTLLLSAHPSYARVQLTTISYKNPPTPPNFCMVMRKYLEGSILQSIEQIENDRVIMLTFSSRNELGDLENIVLIVELMGRHSNIVLMNKETHKIIDTIKHVGASQNSYRLLLPGADYVTPPKQTLMNPWVASPETVFDYLNTEDNLDRHSIQTTFQGFGKDTANELVRRLEEKPHEKLSTFQYFMKELKDEKRPTLGLVKGKEGFSPLPYAAYDEIVTQESSLSLLLDAYYEGKAERDRVKQQAGELIRRVKNDQQKLKKKIIKLEQSLVDADNAEIYRIKGELLTTFLSQIPRGKQTISLDNYYDDNKPIEIGLNVELTPNQNAQKYFQRYQKLKNGVSVVTEQIEKAKQELWYLDTIASQLDYATPQELVFIQEELVSEGYIKPKLKDKKKKKVAPSKPERFLSSDGTTILVGKNNLQNDQLTMKTAHKLHVWLHAKNIPGSHVIIESMNPSDQTIEEAAKLAAFYSKYRLSSSVPVDYVQVKYVKKPNGAKPGYVIYENQHTIYVTPDKELIEQLKN